MAFGKANREVDKTTIVFNSNITLSGIPWKPTTMSSMVNRQTSG
jgi:hypothetical protein